MRKPLRRLKGYTGRVLRNLRRQLDEAPEGPLRERVLDKLLLVSRLLRQMPKDKGKIYALHEPEVDCISKGKARVRYEFGTKVSVATTLNGGSIVGLRSLSGNPYDGHTLVEALEQVEILTNPYSHGAATRDVLGLTPPRAPPWPRRPPSRPSGSLRRTRRPRRRCVRPTRPRAG